MLIRVGRLSHHQNHRPRHRHQHQQRHHGDEDEAHWVVWVGSQSGGNSRKSRGTRIDLDIQNKHIIVVIIIIVTTMSGDVVGMFRQAAREMQ